MNIRAVAPRDADNLAAFLLAIPPEDRAFFKEDFTDPATLGRWLDDRYGSRLIAVDQTIAGAAAVWAGVGRSEHVGELRIYVPAEHRRRGIGQELARGSLVAALRRGLTKITVEVVATEQGTIDMFLQLGFEPEALLRDHLRHPVRAGDTQDVVLLAHFSEAAGSDAAFAGADGRSA